MKFGLTQEQFQFKAEKVISPLQNQGASVWCYGSRARGDHQEFSDLELMVEAPADLAQSISLIEEILQNSNFPYKVDLVQFKDFAESYKPGYHRDKTRLLVPS